MPTIVHEKPEFSSHDVTSFFTSNFRLDIQTIKPLPSERDQNFMIKDSKGSKYVGKIFDGKESKDQLQYQTKAMQYIASHASSDQFSSPYPVEAGDGEFLIPIVSASQTHFARLVTYVDGTVLAKYKPHDRTTQRLYGKFIGQLTNALQGFNHPSVHRQFYWDLAQAHETVKSYLPHIKDPDNHDLVSYFYEVYMREVYPHLSKLPASVVHNDCNDYNVIVSVNEDLQPHFGLIDFGDMVYSKTVHELAIAAAYMILKKPDPLSVIQNVIGGYLLVAKLSELELHCLYLSICMRLCMSVCISSFQMSQEPDNEYLIISQQPAFETLKKLRHIHHRLARYLIKTEAGLSLSSDLPPVAWDRLQTHVLFPQISTKSIGIIDLGIASSHFDLAVLTSPQVLVDAITDYRKERGWNIAIGRYLEPRLINSAEQYKGTSLFSRNTHLGIDLFVEPETLVAAPFDGTVHSFSNNTVPYDYGPTIILQHKSDDQHFYTLYGHLSTDSLDNLEVGQPIAAGQVFAKVGPTIVNGGWSPHLHFQLVLDIFDYHGDYPGVIDPRHHKAWSIICPDPNLLLNLHLDTSVSSELMIAPIKAKRDNLLGKALSLSYNTPLKIVRGHMQYLYDNWGRRFIDGVNNVPHVGHSNPTVVKSLTQQVSILNTNTRYFHDTILTYSDALLATLPQSIRDEYVCYFVNSGSEANELALRLARAYTGNDHVIVLDGAYHGHTQMLIDISPYKFDGPGGKGKPDFVSVMPMPYPYRGKYVGYGSETTSKYINDVRSTISELEGNGTGIAAFISEAIMGVGGQVVYPDNYLKELYQIIRDAGGVCIADEVQTGFGRVGDQFWAFQTQQAIPDIVTMGKPMGNGHPIGGVMVRREIAEAFDNGMEYFNTFGGNPVSCAVGLSVLNYIRNHNLQEHARRTGEYFKQRLLELQSTYPLMGDIRGKGLFLGIELVTDRDKKTPAAKEASYIVNRMKDLGILLSTDGPDHNVIKIKPPLVITKQDVNYICDTLGTVLSDTCLGL